MIDPTIYTFTAAELAKRDVDNQRIGWTKHRIAMMERGHFAKEADDVKLFDWDGAAAAIPYPQPTRSLREEPDPEQSSIAFRYSKRDGVIQDDAGSGWISSAWYPMPWRVTLWHDLMLHPWKCDGCGATLASETEEHQCP